MGYSIAVYLPTKEARDEMLAFLETQPWEELSSKQGYGYHLEPGAGEDLGPYPPKKARERMLGFAGSTIPDYAWAVCSWVALQAGEPRTKGKSKLFYDNEPITVSNDPTTIDHANYKGVRCNDKGIMLPSRTPPGFWGAMVHLFDQSRRNSSIEFMEELNLKWQARTNEAAPRKSSGPK